LKRRGHDVRFDRSAIRFGDDWRRAITDGIVASQRVLSFLSRHSTRDAGTDVQLPVNIGHVQWLDIHDWKERKERGSIRCAR
jgi:hypothetical protein